MWRTDGLSRRQALAAVAAGAMLPAAAFLPRSASALPSREALGGWLGPRASFTLSNATVQLHDGSVVRPGGIRVEDGLIVELGQAVRGGQDLDGAWLCPGLVDAGSSIGLLEVGLESATHDHDESGGPVQPDARVVDAYNPRSNLLPVARSGGVLHALVTPALNRLVPGQAAMMRLGGLTVDEATVRAPVGLCVCMGRAGTGGEGAPKTRMGVAAKLRELLDLAEKPEEDEEAGGRKRKEKKAPAGEEPEDEKSAAERTWKEVRAGRLPVLVLAHRADDLLTALRLREDYGLSIVLVGAAEAWMVAPELAAAGVGVLLGPVDVQPDSFEHPHARYDNAAALHAAGVPFAFRTDNPHNSRLLPTLAGLTVAHGLPREAAIHAMTAAAGKILGIEGLGVLEVGRPATFFQIAGDPIQPRHAVQAAWIDGQPISLESHQTRLHEQFRTLR